MTPADRVAANLASLNELCAEMITALAGHGVSDEGFADMTQTVLRDHTWALGFEFQGVRPPGGEPLAKIPAVQDIPDNEWGRLAMHLASMHADPMAPERSYRGNAEQHEHEHDGPGTIRNHPRASREFDQLRAWSVIAEGRFGETPGVPGV